MLTSDTVRLLRWHAGLQDDALDPASVSGAIATGSGMSEAAAAFMVVLERFNHELNGPRPSEQIDVSAGDVPRDAAYAVSEVTRMLREADRHDAAGRVDTAWNAVLAGDVDDLAEHIEHHRASG